MNLLLGSVLVVFLNLGAAAGTLYLAVGEFGGDGTKLSPLRVNSATHFDAVLDAVERGQWDTLDLGAGVFETQGLWRFPLDRRAALTDFATLTRPIRIRGAGMRQTTIRLSEYALTRANGLERPDLAVMRFGLPWRNNGGPYEVEDLTVDGNAAAFSTNRVVAGGLVFHSNNVTCRRVRIIGLRGSFTLPNHPEAFGILINNFDSGPYLGPDGNNRLVDCVVESNGDIEDYVSPFYIGVQERGRPLLQSEIVGCRTIGTGIKPCRLGVSLQSGVVIDRFSGHNVVHAIYNDTGSVRDAIVRNSRFTGISYSGVWFTVDTPKDRVLIDRCEFNFTPAPDTSWIGLTIWDTFGSGALASDIEVRDCIFRGASPSGIKFTPMSVSKAKLSNIKWTANVQPTNSIVQAPVAGVLSRP